MIEVEPMRSNPRIGSGTLLGGGGGPRARARRAARAAESPICPWPADVPEDLLGSIATCTNCLKNKMVQTGQVPCPPLITNPNDVWVNARCYEFPEDPDTALCDSIASAEVKGCSKAVDDAARCNDAVNAADATAGNAICSTFVDPSEAAACSSNVQSELAAQKEAVEQGGCRRAPDLLGSRGLRRR